MVLSRAHSKAFGAIGGRNRVVGIVIAFLAFVIASQPATVLELVRNSVVIGAVIFALIYAALLIWIFGREPVKSHNDQVERISGLQAQIKPPYEQLEIKEQNDTSRSPAFGLLIHNPTPYVVSTPNVTLVANSCFLGRSSGEKEARLEKILDSQRYFRDIDYYDGGGLIHSDSEALVSIARVDINRGCFAWLLNPVQYSDPKDLEPNNSAYYEFTLKIAVTIGKDKDPINQSHKMGLTFSKTSDGKFTLVGEILNDEQPTEPAT